MAGRGQFRSSAKPKKTNLFQNLSCNPKETGAEQIIGNGALLVKIEEWTSFEAPFNLQILLLFSATAESQFGQDDDGRRAALALHLEKQSMFSYRIGYYSGPDKLEEIGELRMTGEATPIRNEHGQIDYVRIYYMITFAEKGRGRLVITVGGEPFPPPRVVQPGLGGTSDVDERLAKRMPGSLVKALLSRPAERSTVPAPAFSILDQAKEIVHNKQMRDDTESQVAVVHAEDDTPGRLSRLETENQALRDMLSSVEERLEFLEDSLDAQLARSEHQNSGGASYSIKDIAAKLGL